MNSVPVWVSRWHLLPLDPNEGSGTSRVEKNFPLGDYRRIKCNIARRGGERIYHLPFDQQYDTTVIESARGECYVATAGEAEQLGFRRAWRWRGGDA